MYSRDAFLEDANPRWEAMAANGLVEFLRTSGLHLFTMGALARWARVSTAAVAQRAPRDQTLRLIVQRLGMRYHRWSVRPAYWLVEPRLPIDAEQRHGVWVWALTAELARGDPEAESLRAAAWARERADVAAWWRAEAEGVEGVAGAGAAGAGAAGAGGGGEDAFEEYYAVLTGLRLAMALGVTTLSPDAARELLDRLSPPRLSDR